MLILSFKLLSDKPQDGSSSTIYFNPSFSRYHWRFKVWTFSYDDINMSHFLSFLQLKTTVKLKQTYRFITVMMFLSVVFFKSMFLSQLLFCMRSPLKEGKGCLGSRAVKEFTVQCYLVAIRQSIVYKDINWMKGALMCLLKNKLSLMTGNATDVLQT